MINVFYGEHFFFIDFKVLLTNPEKVNKATSNKE